MATKTQVDLSKIILMPHVSEKSVMLGENNKQQTFKVIKDASKNDIKKAVEFLFDVEVDRVRVVNVEGKNKNFGRTRGKRKSYKKAFITLKGEQDIDLGVNS